MTNSFLPTKFNCRATRLPWSITNRANREATCPVLTMRG